MPSDTHEPPPTGSRKLAAILAADVAGYSRLMADDDQATVTALQQARAVFRESIEAHSGRLIDTAGDSVLAEFRSVVEAVQCAVEVQEKLAEINAPVAEARRMLFRIGVNQGDVIEEEDGTIYGDGVNVAARLEGLAEPGTANVSGKVYEEVRDRLALGFAFIGEHEVKNIPRPVPAYRVTAEASEPAPLRRKRRPVIGIAAALTAVIIAGATIWWLVGIPEPSEMATPSGDPVLVDPDTASVAVLPFADLSGSDEYAFLADGLHENIIASLSQARRLFVPARYSTLQYRDAEADMSEVARQLGVEHVLEGSVQVAGDQIRIVMQLIEVASGGHVWAERYDRPLDDIFALQDDITLEVVSALQVELTEGPQALRWRGGTNNIEAWEKWQQGVALLRKANQADNARAQSLFASAVADDPGFALGWAYLGWALEYTYRYRWEDHADGLLQAKAHVEKALAADDTLAAAYGLQVMIHRDLHEHEAAIAAARRGVELDPGGSLAHAHYALMLYTSGSYELAMTELDEAIRLSPVHPHWYLLDKGTILLNSGHPVEGAHWLERYSSLVPDDPEVQYILPIALARASREADAMAAIARLRNKDPALSIEVVRNDTERIWAYKDRAIVAGYLATLRDLGVPEHSPDAEARRPVIAVLPFDNLSGDPSQEYFADGITEDIITRLAQYPDILVLGRNTTFQFKGEAVDIPAISEKLGADYVVEGSIRRSGDTVRVTAQLLAAEEGTHLWAETFDRALDAANIFSIQDEITETVAGRIGDVHGAISLAQSARGDRQAPKYFSSYDCILRAHEFVRQVGPETHSVARDCLEGVIESEPDYAEALAYLGNLYLLEIAVGLNPLPDSSLDRALSTLERAVFLDPNSGIGHVIYAQALYLTDDPQRAIREAEEALRLEPNNSDIIGWAAEVFSNVGAYERTVEIMDRLTILNPKYPGWMNWNMAKVHMARGEFGAAISRLEANQMNWYFLTHVFLAAAHCASDDLERGKIALDTALSAYPGFRDAYWQEVYFWQKAGTRPMIDALTSGLTACGWDIPPDPGPEAFAQ